MNIKQIQDNQVMNQQINDKQKHSSKQKSPTINKNETVDQVSPKQNKSRVKSGKTIPQQKQQKTKTEEIKKIEQRHDSAKQQLKILEQDREDQQQEQKQKPKFALKIKSQEEIKQQVKRWKQITKKLQKKRQIQYQIFTNKLSFEKQKEQQQQKIKHEQEQQARREQIKKKLEQIQKRKNKRIQQNILSKKLMMEYEKKQPLFIEKQKQFHQRRQAAEQQIKQNILKKKQQMMVDMEQLKKHEEKFINHLKQRFKKVNKSSSRSLNKSRSDENSGEKDSQLNRAPKSQFNMHINSDPLQKQKDLQKYLRRKKFEEKVKKIPISIDKQKMKQALIAKDKFKNPLKYNYLSNVAALSDEKIYDQFKDFEININKKELGNDYMRQIHQKIPNSSRIRSQSESNLKPIQKYEYKNYLPDVKSLLKRKIVQPKEPPTNQVQQILYKYDNKSERLTQLNRKSNQYKNQVLKKIVQIQRLYPKEEYSDYLGKQKVIDELYMKSIQMKLATAQIS